MSKYDHVAIRFMRDEENLSWHEIAGRLGTETDRVLKAHSRWKMRQAKRTDNNGRVLQEWRREPSGTIHIKYPEPPVDEEAVKKIWRACLDDIEEYAPRHTPPKPAKMTGEPMLAVPSFFDAHFGMKAWGEETGQPSQDINTISDDWRRGVDHLVGLSRVYDVERYCLPLGHDLSHVDHWEGKVATTRGGTPQDVDSRMAKIFTAIRRASVYLIDACRSTGVPVDVMMVKGNHDADVCYKLGEVIQAWYRHDDQVSVDNDPIARKFYGWHDTALMMYHGEFMLKKTGDAIPPLVFATECPAKIWVASEGGSREILSGHLHARRQGRYIPTSDVNETRGIIARSLPGLTSTDKWHSDMGYLHKRAATLLIYKKSGGLHALHEFSP